MTRKIKKEELDYGVPKSTLQIDDLKTLANKIVKFERSE